MIAFGNHAATPAHERPAATIYVDHAAYRIIEGRTLLTAGIGEVGGWLASPGAPSIVSLATEPSLADYCGDTQFVQRYDGRLDAKLQDHGVSISGAWHSHPRGSALRPSQHDIAADLELARRLELLTVASIIARCDDADTVSLFGYFVHLDASPQIEPAAIEVLTGPTPPGVVVA
jgi:proteasome lid subunit RPN8/RPN11